MPPDGFQKCHDGDRLGQKIVTTGFPDFFVFTHVRESGYGDDGQVAMAGMGP